MSLPATFAAKVVTSTCTVWVGATNTQGYGLIVIDGEVELAHRVAYSAKYGPIPDGMVIDHLCRVRNCVTPAHLEAVTTAENNRRGRAASALAVGDECINGHQITSADDIYTRPTGYTECRACRAAGATRASGRRRPTCRKQAASVIAAIEKADTTRTSRRAS